MLYLHDDHNRHAATGTANAMQCAMNKIEETCAVTNGNVMTHHFYTELIILQPTLLLLCGPADILMN